MLTVFRGTKQMPLLLPQWLNRIKKRTVQHVCGFAGLLALSVASLINGPILGVFLVGTFLKRAGENHALIGMAASIALMLYILLATKIAWTWYALIGSVTTLIVAAAASFLPS